MRAYMLRQKGDTRTSHELEMTVVFRLRRFPIVKSRTVRLRRESVYKRPNSAEQWHA